MHIIPSLRINLTDVYIFPDFRFSTKLIYNEVEDADFRRIIYNFTSIFLFLQWALIRFVSHALNCNKYRLFLQFRYEVMKVTRGLIKGIDFEVFLIPRKSWVLNIMYRWEIVRNLHEIG